MKSIFHFWGQFDKSTATNMSDFLCNECGYEGMGMASMYWSGLNLTFYRESYGASEKSSEPLRNYLSVWEYKQACAILIERLRNLGASEKCKVAVKHLLKKTFPSVCTKRIRVLSLDMDLSLDTSGSSTKVSHGVALRSHYQQESLATWAPDILPHLTASLHFSTLPDVAFQ